MTAGPGPQPKDFRRLRDSGAPAGASKGIGGAIAAARDDLARWLLRRGATPNHLSVAGFLFTLAAAGCLLRGASMQLPVFHTGVGATSWWPLGAAALLFCSGACDMLDGAIARVGAKTSRSGGVLDSSLDRFSDMAVYLACAMHFALLAPANITCQVLAVVAMCNSFLISYIKARAETEIPDCSVGYWLRGERFAAVLIGCASGHMAAVLWQLAALPALTVARRLQFTFAYIAAEERGVPLPAAGPDPGWRGRLQLWRYPRGSRQYDVVTGSNIAFILFGPLLLPALLGDGPMADPLRAWLLP